MFTDEEKREIVLDMARTFRPFADNYEPHLTDGQIAHTSPCIIKSRLKGRQAWTDGQIAMVFEDASIYAKLPEWNAEKWHQQYDSLDFLAESVLAPSSIFPALHDDFAVWFSHGASIQRAYYDLFWITFRNSGLRFEQDVEFLNSPILVFNDSGLVGIISPVGFGDREEDLRPLVQIVLDFHEYKTEKPCDKCGSGQDVWLWAKDRSKGMEGIPICHFCYLDKEGFTEYIKAGIEEALDEQHSS